MTRKEFAEQLAIAKAAVESRPDWKKNILENLSKSTSDSPRPCVDNSGPTETSAEFDRRTGHNQPCYYCGRMTSNIAGDPRMWAVALCHPDEPGVVKWHHTGCVMERLQRLEELESTSKPAAGESSRPPQVWLRREAEGRPAYFVLEPGIYYVGDPCYVLDRLYDEMMRIKWAISSPNDLEFETPGGRIVVFDTKVGDGVFPLSCVGAADREPRRGLCVDSGQLAFVNVRCIDRHDYTPAKLGEISGQIVVIQPTTYAIDPHSNVTGPDFFLTVHQPEEPSDD